MSEIKSILILALLGLSLAWTDETYDYNSTNPCYQAEGEKNETTCLAKKPEGGECCYLKGFWYADMKHASDCYWNLELEGPEKIKAFWDEEPNEESGGYKVMTINCKSYDTEKYKLSPVAFSSWDDINNPYDKDQKSNPCISKKTDKNGCLNVKDIEGECCFLEGKYWKGEEDTDCFWNRYGDNFTSIKNFWDDDEYETRKVTCAKTKEINEATKQEVSEKEFDNIPWNDEINKYDEGTTNPCAQYELNENGCLSQKAGKGECCFLNVVEKSTNKQDTDCFWNKYSQTGLEIKNFWDDDKFETTKIKCPSLNGKDYEPILLFHDWNDMENPYEKDSEINPCISYENDTDQCLAVTTDTECCVLTTVTKSEYEEGTDCFWNKYMNSLNTIKGFWDDDEYETTKIQCQKTNNKVEYVAPKMMYAWHDELNPYIEDSNVNPCMKNEHDSEKCLSIERCVFLTGRYRKDNDKDTDCFWNKYGETAVAIKNFWDDNEFYVVKVQTAKDKEESFPKIKNYHDRLKNGAVAGIAVACFVFGIIIASLVACCVCKKKNTNEPDTYAVETKRTTTE